MTDHLVNTYLGQYRLIEVVRQGGMATVYKAHQPSLDRFVAVKLLLERHDPQFVARFRAEARAIAQLQHPHILPIYDYGEQDGLFYLVLQYVEGGAALVDLGGTPIAPARAIYLITRLLAALDYAHARGIVHRDIKPANVLLPTPDWPMLADFGIAKLLADLTRQLTATGTVMGTPAYMAPEQALGQPVDARTDLYSVGVVLYELLTGHVPFDAESPPAVLMQQAYVAPPPPRQLNPDLSPAVESLLLRALAKNPAERYQSARAMAEELERMAAQLGPANDDRSITRLYAAGVQAFEEGHWNKAIAHLNQVVALAPDHADAADLLSAVHATQERANAAARRQQLAESRQPDPAPSHALRDALAEAANQGMALAREQTLALRPADQSAMATARTTAPPIPLGRQQWRIVLLALVTVLALGGAAAFVWMQLGKSAAGTAHETTPSASSAAATALQTGGGIVQPSATAQASALTPLIGDNIAQARGTLTWRDAALWNDGVTITVTGLPAPATGEVYAAWLASEQSSLALGPLHAANGSALTLTYASPTHDDLLGHYDRVYITKVPDIAVATEVANVIMAGTLPAAELAHIRHVLFSYDTTPNQIGFALGLRQELDELLQHAQLLKGEMEAGRLSGEQLHVEHIINIIEGRQGQHFGDLNHDGKVQNPGDGFGVLENGPQQGYINGMVEHALLAATAPDAPGTAKRQADEIRATGAVIRERVSTIRDLALTINQANKVGETQDNVRKILDLVQQAIDGANGALPAYQQTQAMAAITIAPVTPNTIINAPAPAAIPAPDAAVTTIVAGDNTFTPSKIAVVRGTRIVWSNQGNTAHTVTADDGTFDSKTLARGATFAQSFTTPGVFPYYCQLHGGPHGEGMSGTIIVTDQPPITPTP